MFLHIFDQIFSYSRNPTQEKYDYICEMAAGSLAAGHITPSQSISLMSQLVRSI